MFPAQPRLALPVWEKYSAQRTWPPQMNKEESYALHWCLVVDVKRRRRYSGKVDNREMTI